MAEKMVFISSTDNFFEEKIIEYTYYSGFAVSQKQKSIDSLHDAIRKQYPGKEILEISTKSEQEEGVKLSAFNLPFFHEELQEYRHIENIFQSSKVFEYGGPYRDLLNVAPKDAKRDERLRTSGQLVCFELYGQQWPLNPKSIFYDWIYITALKQNKDLAGKLLKYDIFTDIEFNHKKSINCQARAAAIYVSLCRQNMLDEKTKSLETFKSVYLTEEAQLSFI